MLTGIGLILFMPLATRWRFLLIVAWVGESCRELRALVRGAARLRSIRLDSEGHVSGRNKEGRNEVLTLLTGSIVLSRVAWLRVRFPDGGRYAELVWGDPARDLEWQRLQLIWRHNRTAFGQQDVS